MIDNSAYIKELADANKCRLESVRKSLKDAPRGTLCIRMRESGIYFTRHLGDKEKGITKRPDLVVELMRKRKLFAEEKSLSDTQEILDTIYEQLREIEKRKLATSRIPIEAIESVGMTLADVSAPVEVFRWLKSNQNSFKEKELKFVTNNGVRVRSKSEKIIGDKLEELGIPYIYEASLRLPNGRYFSPDFTLLSLRNELK